MANTAIEKKNSAGSLATINLRSDSGRGSEEIKSDDMSTPILKILHQLSPECNKSNAKYVEGSQPGMIYAKGLGKLIDGMKEWRFLLHMCKQDFQNGRKWETQQLHLLQHIFLFHQMLLKKEMVSID